MPIKPDRQRMVLHEGFVPGTLYMGQRGEVFLYTLEGNRHKYEFEDMTQVTESIMVSLIVAMPLTHEEVKQYFAEKRADFERVKGLVEKCSQSQPLKTKPEPVPIGGPIDSERQTC